MPALGVITFGGITSDDHRVVLLGAGSVLTILWANHLRFAWRQEYLRRTPRT